MCGWFAVNDHLIAYILRKCSLYFIVNCLTNLAFMSISNCMKQEAGQLKNF